MNELNAFGFSCRSFRFMGIVLKLCSRFRVGTSIRHTMDVNSINCPGNKMRILSKRIINREKESMIVAYAADGTSFRIEMAEHIIDKTPTNWLVKQNILHISNKYEKRYEKCALTKTHFHFALLSFRIQMVHSQ